MPLGYGYMRNSLAHLGAYPTHRDIADSLLFLLCLYDQGAWRAYQPSQQKDIYKMC